MRPRIRGLHRVALAVIILFALCPALSLAEENPDKVKLFLLAGQSNMEGKGSVVVMNHQLSMPAKQARFTRYKDGDRWAERDDVSIVYLGNRGRRQGKLTVGYGISQKDSHDLFGPELGFGWTVGDYFDQPILIVKTAWGGKSLDRDFRPPSRGLPDSVTNQFENANKRNPNLTIEEYKQGYGHYYRQMIDEVLRVIGDPATYLPDYQNQGIQIAGFVWFQGWNDQYAPTSAEDYQENMIALIRDVRRDLNAPDLPVVIGAMGHNGAKQDGKIRTIADAQAAAAEHPDWNRTVVTVRTAKYWDTEAEAAFARHWADPKTRDIEKWRQYGNDRPYHYLGSPNFFNDTGIAFGEAMIQLIQR
jgi:alpha-galactosidase